MPAQIFKETEDNTNNNASSNNASSPSSHLHHEQHLNDVFHEQESKVKKYIIITLALFLIILITIYFILGQHIFGIIEGRIASQQFTNLAAVYNNYTIRFTQESFDELQHYYFANQKAELSICLLGKFSAGSYNIEKLFYPKITSQAFNYVAFQSCPEHTIIVLHTHPYKSCIFSVQDINSYQQNKQSSPDVMIALMCEENRFTFYRE